MPQADELDLDEDQLLEDETIEDEDDDLPLEEDDDDSGDDSDTDSPPELHAEQIANEPAPNSPKWFRKTIQEKSKEVERKALENKVLQKELEALRTQVTKKDAPSGPLKKPERYDYATEDEYDSAIRLHERSIVLSEVGEYQKQQSVDEVKKSRALKYQVYKKDLDNLAKNEAEWTEKLVWNMLGEETCLSILDGFDKPADIFFKLANSPKILERIADEGNPIKRLREIVNLEITPIEQRKPKTKPEQAVEPAGGHSGSTVVNLEKEYKRLQNMSCIDQTGFNKYLEFKKKNKDRLQKHGII